MKYRIQISGTFEINSEEISKENLIKELNTIKLNEFVTLDEVSEEDVSAVE